MATYTSNYAWAKPSGSDPVDISVLNDNLDSQDGIMHDAFLNMADPFSESSTYAVGAIVLYGTKTYKCHTAVTTAGSWTGATNWDEYKLSEGGLVAGDYVNITNGIINVQTDIGTYDNIRYEFTPTNGGYYVTVTIYINNIQRFQQSYHNDDMHTPIIIENLIRFWYGGDGYYWHYQPLIDSNEHPQNTDIRWYYNDMTVHEETFDVPQDDSTTLVTKGDLDDADGDIYAVMGQMGAKNLIPYPYYNASGTENRGITYTYDNEGALVANGTTSEANLESAFSIVRDAPIKAGKYKISGCPAGGSESSYWISVYLGGESSPTVKDMGAGATFEVANDTTIRIQARIYRNGYHADHVTFSPMLRLASDTDDTYQPYAKTNKQLTDAVSSILTEQDIIETELDTKADKTATASGETLALVPTSEGRALLRTAYGMSVQNGTPTPSSPVDIESAKANFTSTHGQDGATVTTDLTLRAIEVTSSDAYNLVRDNKYYIADTLDYTEDDGFVVTRRVGEYTVLGNEGWNYVGDTGSKRVYIAQSSLGISAKSDATKQGYSSHFIYNGKTVSSIVWGNYYLSGSNLVISLNNNIDITDLTTAEAWLSSNNPKFDYIRVAPTTETITTAQALALLGLKTYDESTTISSQAEPSCTVAIEYAKERLGALALTAYNTAKGNDLRITALES